MTTEQHCADRADARRDRIADTVRRLGTQLREDRRERGPHVADAAWVDEPFDDWLAIDRAELALGSATGRPRVKIEAWSALMRLCAAERAREYTL